MDILFGLRRNRTLFLVYTPYHKSVQLQPWFPKNKDLPKDWLTHSLAKEWEKTAIDAERIIKIMNVLNYQI